MDFLANFRTPAQRQILRDHFLDRRWFVVALGVGTILNLINQYDAFFGGKLISMPKLLLTFLLPYLVSSLSAWQARSESKRALEDNTRVSLQEDLVPDQV